jgi:hypothetical protein
MLVAAAAATAVAASAAPAGADVLLASVSRPTTVAAFSGAVAWRNYDAAHQRYALMVLRAGHLTRAPVATRRAPFDVSLGPTAGGKIAAVYSRCSTDPGRRTAADVLSYLRGYVPNPQTGRVCRLREYVLGEKHERTPRILGLGGISTAFPSTWRGRVVFAGSQRVHGHLRTAVYAARTRGVSRARRLAAGPAPAATLAPRVTGTALRGTRVVFGWDWLVTGSGGASGVFSTALGSHRASLDARETEDEGQYFSPGLDTARVNAGLFSDADRRGGVAFLAGDASSAFLALSPYVASTAVDGSQIYYSVSTAPRPGEDCTNPGVAAAPATCGVYLSTSPAP